MSSFAAHRMELFSIGTVLPAACIWCHCRGQVEFATNEGEKRLFGPGDVILVEDVTGGGHTTKCVGEWVRITVVIPWEE